MVSRSKREVLELLNKQVKRTYKASLLSGIFLVIELILVLIFAGQLRTIIMAVSVLVLIANYKRIEGSCKEELAYIYVNNKLVCSKLSFFSIVEKDVSLKCMIGVVKIDKIAKERRYKDNKQC